MSKRNKRYTSRLAPLVGGTIVSVLTDASGEFYGLRIRLKGVTGTYERDLWFSSDDEGNDIGSFSIEKAE